MHLGFHIFDISCKSPNVEATKPMVYVTDALAAGNCHYPEQRGPSGCGTVCEKRYQSRAI